MKHHKFRRRNNKTVTFFTSFILYAALWGISFQLEAQTSPDEIKKAIQNLSEMGGAPKASGHWLLDKNDIILPYAHEALQDKKSNLTLKVQLITVLGEIANIASIEPIISATKIHSELTKTAFLALAQIPDATSSFEFSSQQLLDKNTSMASKEGAMWYFVQHKDKRALIWAKKIREEALGKNDRLENTALYLSARLGDQDVKARIIEKLKQKKGSGGQQYNLLMALAAISKPEEFISSTSHLNKNNRFFQSAKRLNLYKFSSGEERIKNATQMLKSNFALEKRKALQYLISKNLSTKVESFGQTFGSKIDVFTQNQIRLKNSFFVDKDGDAIPIVNEKIVLTQKYATDLTNQSITPKKTNLQRQKDKVIAQNKASNRPFPSHEKIELLKKLVANKPDKNNYYELWKLTVSKNKESEIAKQWLSLAANQGHGRAIDQLMRHYSPEHSCHWTPKSNEVLKKYSRWIDAYEGTRWDKGFDTRALQYFKKIQNCLAKKVAEAKLEDKLLKTTIQKLLSSNDEAWLEAIETVKKMELRALPAIPALLKNAHLPDSSTAWGALGAIKKIDPKGKVVKEKILAMLDDPRPHIKENGLYGVALYAKQLPHIIEKLDGLLASPSNLVAGRAALALAKYKDVPESTKEKIKKLQDRRDSRLFSYSSQALDQIYEANLNK